MVEIEESDVSDVGKNIERNTDRLSPGHAHRAGPPTGKAGRRGPSLTVIPAPDPRGSTRRGPGT
ncbi:MAG: hypothetical protein RBU35_02300 [Anaerolineae bacterium]|jgi:hypothetical protein|nr:hypothetical protein [Anaerolineae bacterium]